MPSKTMGAVLTCMPYMRQSVGCTQYPMVLLIVSYILQDEIPVHRSTTDDPVHNARAVSFPLNSKAEVGGKTQRQKKVDFDSVLFPRGRQFIFQQ